MLLTAADRPPRGLIAAKLLLAVLLVVGTVAPQVGGFEGKGMGFRLPIFIAPALVVPIRWWRRRGPYPAALDAALTLPFLGLSTAGGAVGAWLSRRPVFSALVAVARETMARQPRRASRPARP